jgi:hypothetical protein
VDFEQSTSVGRLDGRALCRASDARGLVVTARQLERFRAQGLLPRPARTSQNGMAPQWTYPPGTDAQLIALLLWRQHTKNRDLVLLENRIGSLTWGLAG